MHFSPTVYTTQLFQPFPLNPKGYKSFKKLVHKDVCGRRVQKETRYFFNPLRISEHSFYTDIVHPTILSNQFFTVHIFISETLSFTGFCIFMFNKVKCFFYPCSKIYKCFRICIKILE